MAACGFRPVKKPSGACEEANITDIEKFRGASWRRRCFDPEAEAQELQEQDSEGRGEAPPEAVAAALDLFCIGTVADMAPLTGANRYWLQKGLAELHRSQNLGLAALQKICDFGERKLYTEDIGFQLAPRINAVGRLGDPSLVVDLLCTSDEGEAMRLAKICDQLNQHRRKLCRVIEEEAIALLEADE